MRIIIIIFAMLFPLLAHAQTKPKIIASFSIIGDMTKQIAGDNIELKTLVGANGDAHEYEPTPADAKALANADLVLVNGLHFEGWLDRLVKSSGYKGKIVVVSNGINAIPNDPHAWQNLQNGKIYVQNIAQALTEIDAEHAQIYNKNAQEYLHKIEQTDIWVKKEIAQVPVPKRKIISSHDAFTYFSAAYGVEFIAQQGVSTEAQISAQDMAKLIDQIRAQKITALFVENMTDARLIKQLEKDAGAKLGGVLYSDALSAENEPAPAYLLMFKHNVPLIVAAMLKNP